MELVQTYKSMGTPTIVIGDKVIVGFRQAEIEAALAG
jgi:protein-disulfide isomerase